MGTQIKLSWWMGVCMGLMALVHCGPVEYVYTGDGCEPPTRLEYQINVPKLSRPRSHRPLDYGYKVDVPVQAKAKVSYSFDFTVEEPRTPKPEKPNRWNLYAKVDRVAMRKDDYEDGYGLGAASAPPSCRCGQCGISKPMYRYVFQKVLPCMCRQPNCKCHLGGLPSVNGIVSALATRPPTESRSGTNNIRRKRDLQKTFYRIRKGLGMERPGRFVKQYHKNLHEDRPDLFDFNSLVDLDGMKSKRKTKKVFLPRLHSRLVKRDIKGEYEQLEKDREQMDLTLPEIVQYMPETLAPDFKRGQCQFGCGKKRPKPKAGTEAPKETTVASVETTSAREGSQEAQSKEQLFQEKEEMPHNNVENSFTKRNAVNYNYRIPLSRRAAPTASAIPTIELPSFFTQNAYGALPPPPIPTNPFLLPDLVYSATRPAKVLPSSPFAYDDFARHSQYSESDDNLSLYAPTTSEPNPTDPTPLRYMGDLEKSRSSGVFDSYHNEKPLERSSGYPVEYISNEHLDKIIADIIYRHPDFLDATVHYGGALVDPEPMQEEQTKDFLKKLIDGRLNQWFSEEEDHISPLYSPDYDSSYANLYNTSPGLTYFPTLF